MQLVSPGAWLSDLCQERYEVREKKASKKVLTGFPRSSLYPLLCLFNALLHTVWLLRNAGKEKEIK